MPLSQTVIPHRGTWARTLAFDTSRRKRQDKVENLTFTKYINMCSRSNSTKSPASVAGWCHRSGVCAKLCAI